MKVVDCTGDGRSRGRAHGEEARELVRAALARWAETTAAASGMPIDRYTSGFLRSTSLIATTRRLLPDLEAEIQGIAEGAGVSFDLVAAYNLMDEQWWYEHEAARGCSVLALADGPRVLLAQNMDLPAFMDGSQLVLRLAGPDQPEALVLTSAGLIGLTGVNRAGVAVCVNTLMMLPHRTEGLPVAAVLRGALANESLDAAVAFLRTAPHASGQHYAVASPDGVVGLECSAAGAVTSSTSPRFAHTNHPLVDAPVDPTVLALLHRRGSIRDSQNRLAFLAARLPEVRDLDDARRLLGDRTTPICMLPTPERHTRTFGAVAFALDDPAQAQFCLGPPCEADWHMIDWSAAVEARGEMTARPPSAQV